MMNNANNIVSNNLSRAWGKAFLETMKHSEISPLIVTLTNGSNELEDLNIREALDSSLNSLCGGSSCHTVANTIFPQSLWNPREKRGKLYARYMNILPRIRKCKGNRYGIYFERLVNYGSDSQNGRINQLEHIITTYKRKQNHRRSALQAAIFDPLRDHTHQRMRGFPCLQQVAFYPNKKKNRLRVIGFYPTQYVYERGYGNYLGLYNLGRFMAHEMGFKHVGLTCIVTVAKYGDGRGCQKGDLKQLRNEIESILSTRE